MDLFIALVESDLLTLVTRRNACSLSSNIFPFQALEGLKGRTIKVKITNTVINILNQREFRISVCLPYQN